MTPVASTPTPARAGATPWAANAALPWQYDIFAGWIVNGTDVWNYSVVHDRDVKQAGAASARVQCVVPKKGEFGGIMQTIAADAFRGKRVRFSAFVRTRDVVGWVGLWMRVDRPNDRGSAFDNMQNRAIKGTTDWTSYAVVLDVAADAVTLNYGLLLANGAGTAWLDNATVEIVNASVPVTNMTAQGTGTTRGRPKAPVNLDLDN